MEKPLCQRKDRKSAWTHTIDIQEKGRTIVTINAVIAEDCLLQPMLGVLMPISFGKDGSGQMIIGPGKEILVDDVEIEKMAKTTALLWRSLDKLVEATSLPVVLKDVPSSEGRTDRIKLYGLSRMEEALVSCHLHQRQHENGIKTTFLQTLLASAPTPQDEPSRAGSEQSSDAAMEEGIASAIFRGIARNSDELLRHGYDLVDMYKSISNLFESNEGLQMIMTAGDIMKFYRPSVDGAPTYPAYIEEFAQVPCHTMKPELPEKHFDGTMGSSSSAHPMSAVRESSMIGGKRDTSTGTQ